MRNRRHSHLRQLRISAERRGKEVFRKDFARLRVSNLIGPGDVNSLMGWFAAVSDDSLVAGMADGLEHDLGKSRAQSPRSCETSC